MMKDILIVSATAAEVTPLAQWVNQQVPGVEVLVTGVGMVATAYTLGRHLADHTYDLIINAGIAGSFDRQIPPGTVLHIVSDTFSELGAEDGALFIPADQLGLADCTFSSFAPLAEPFLTDLPRVRGITVNCVHGHEPTIDAVLTRFGATTESMEGAAVFFAARQAGIPVIQIRAVSNYVEKRNRDNWQIDSAVTNLNAWLTGFLEKINAQKSR
jgi:futalosine hydrolase